MILDDRDEWEPKDAWDLLLNAIWNPYTIDPWEWDS